MLPAYGHLQSEAAGIGVLHEAPLQRVGRSGHIAVRDGFGVLLAHVVLVGQVGFHGELLVAPCGVAEHLQVVHPLVGQVDVAPRVVVVDVGEAHLQPMSIGKEATLRVGVGHADVGVEVIAGVAQHQAAVAFAPCGVAQSAVFQADIVGVVLYAVRRHLVVGIVNPRQVGTIEEPVVPSAHLRRQSELLVVGTSEELHAAFEAFRRDMVGEEIEHTADGIRAIEEGCRPLDHLGAVDGKLVDLESVVVAPLLSLVLHAIFGHRHAVEAQSADGGFRLSGAYRHGLHAGYSLERLHEAAGEVLFQVGMTHLDSRLRRAHLIVASGILRHRHALEADGGVWLLAPQHGGSQKMYHHIFRCLY